MKHCKALLFIVIVQYLLLSCKGTGEEITHQDSCAVSAIDSKFLEGINDQVSFTIYLCGDLPPALKLIEAETKKILADFQHHNAKITFEFEDIFGIEDESERTDLAREVYQKGLRPCDLYSGSGQAQKAEMLFPGGIIAYRGAEYPFTLFDRTFLVVNEELKSYCESIVSSIKDKLVMALKKTVTIKKPTIALLQGHGEADSLRTAALVHEMTDFYIIKRVDLESQEGRFDLHRLDDIDGLIINQPKETFAEEELYIIDQFIMRGGKTFWFIDALHVAHDSLELTGQTFGLTTAVGIDSILMHYGVRLNQDLLAAENAAPIMVNAGFDFKAFAWCFYPLLEVGPEPGINSGTSPARLVYSGTLDTLPTDADITKTVLLEHNGSSRTFKAPVRINYAFTDVKTAFKNLPEQNELVGVRLDGVFDSYYKARLINQGADVNAFSDRSQKTTVVVVSDGDFLLNKYQVLPDQLNKYLILDPAIDEYSLINESGGPRYHYGNLAFFMHLLDEIMYNAN